MELFNSTCEHSTCKDCISVFSSVHDMRYAVSHLPMGVFGTHYYMNTFPLAEGSFYP